MKKTLAFFVLLWMACQGYSQSFEVFSPNKRIKLAITVDGEISWSANLDGKVIIEKVTIGMEFLSGISFGQQAQVRKHTVKQESSMLYPVVPNKDAEIQDVYTELTLSFKEPFKLKFRIYDDGVAYQFVASGKGERNVLSEMLTMAFPKGSRSLFPQEESTYSHNERLYLDKSLAQISTDEFCSLPILFVSGDAKVLFTETALHDYPGLFLKGTSSSSMQAMFPNFVLEIEDAKERPDRNQTITKEASYIAQNQGKRRYPWRVFIITDDDRTLVESNLVFQLSEPNCLEETDWIKPGKVAWDWYNANNLHGVDFVSGLNTQTYKYYIDFASANNIEYVILDEGWTKSTTEILDFNPEMDVPELIRYGQEKGVGLILWVLWKPLDANMNQILDTYERWGAKGIKVDFMQRNDQYMVSSYERIAKACAKRKLLVDFHGSFKPSGLRRKYPNVINYEGVRGSETNKWSKDITPGHNVTIPFIRMAAGPMDYTPGSMSNSQEENFAISFERPMSLGTRAHQVAMYVVYEAPLQMLCDSPSRYYKEQESVDFITQIPTIWDETKVIHGAVGEYIVLARRRGNQWFIGGMTDWSSRELKVELSFLDAESYTMDIFQDGVNANRFAEDYHTTSTTVDQNSTVTLKMAQGGGWAARIYK